MSDCKSWFGHKYEARFDSVPPTIKAAEHWFVEDLVRIIEVSKKKTYIHDICVRCGDIKSRPTTNSER